MKTKLPKVEELFDAGVHYGHQVRRWHPKMEPYIYAAQKNIHIIDLEQTHSLLQKAAEFLYQTAKEGGQIIFVGTKRQAAEITSIEAKRCGALYVTERWLGGTLTNFKMVKKNMDKLVTLIKNRESGELARYTKKERLLIDREIAKLEKIVGGIVNLKGNPSAILVIDVKREKTVVREAKKAGVPVVALIDTNSNPELIDYPIPGNDDAIKSIALVLRVLSDAVEEGYKEFEKNGASAKATKETTTEVEDNKNLRITSTEGSVDEEVKAPEVTAEVLDLPADVKEVIKEEIEEETAKI